MCGIAGFVDLHAPCSAAGLAADVRAMTDAIAYRGPDDSGAWVDADAGVALGHRRLSVVDLSPEGHQPMVSASGRYVIVFNGEIYNYAAIRAELDAAAVHAWRGHSDTEVMLAAIEQWGIDGALGRFNGMFAFALWERTSRTLHLARDRMGEKPLYYGIANGRLAFASEMKALRRVPGFSGEVDREALALYVRLGYVPSPRSIIAGVSKLAPATRAEVRAASGDRFDIRMLRYWDLDAVARAGLRQPSTADEREARALLQEKLEASIALRMVADVPVGAFLSGGVDSSLVVALMQRLSSTPVRTFTIGFADAAFDEAPYARAVANHLGTHHTEVYVTGDDALAVVPALPSIYDEPFADPSQIPTFLVSRVARSQVTVSLSGDAGDELFAGYERYVRGAQVARVPAGLRMAAGAVLRGMPVSTLEAGASAVGRVLPRRLRLVRAGEKLAKLAPVLGETDAHRMYEGLVTHWRGESLPVIASADAASPGFIGAHVDPSLPFEHWMMLVDQHGYLPDDILVKLDRAAMAVSLETRVPLLDHTLVEHAWQVPLSLKLRDGRGKHLLRSLLAELLPAALIERPKRGFAVPLAAWLRGPLRAWAEDLLDEASLRRQGLFDAGRIRARWRGHLDGSRNAHDELWPILCFQAWRAAYD